MTAGRQGPKRLRAWLAAGAIATVFAATIIPARALSGRIVADWHSGLAIGGYDPVAYFTDGKPLAGSPEIELRYGGVVWRFCNVGNRAAFAERPDVYMPQYGGYDPTGVARGVAVAGNPDLWTIASERLFLFYNPAQREKFLADPARLTAIAGRKWPLLLRSLNP
ncbi:MAG: YHS domain-containing (seleno)protein [Xanthobacteraceae bacterium]